jgi:hypothetical protein
MNVPEILRAMRSDRDNLTNAIVHLERLVALRQRDESAEPPDAENPGVALKRRARARTARASAARDE